MRLFILRKELNDMDEKIVEENKKVKEKTNKRFIIGYIIFLILLIIFTIGAIYFSFKYLDDEAERRLAQYEGESNNWETSKKVAEDKVYALSSYAETYDENSLRDIYRQFFQMNISIMELKAHCDFNVLLTNPIKRHHPLKFENNKLSYWLQEWKNIDVDF